MENIPATIVRRLLAAGYTPSQIARAIGVSKKSIRRWRDGTSKPTSEWIHQRLAQLEAGNLVTP